MATENFDWKALCEEQEGEALREKPLAYEFSNGRQFKTEPNSGVYEPQA